MNTKEKNVFSKFRKIALLGFMALVFFSQVNAQSCPTVLKTKTGKVYSANPANIITTGTSNNVRIKFKKTAGRAATQISVYVNNVQQVNKTINYPNGTATGGWRLISIPNANGKQIKVQVINQSIGHTFSYNVSIEGEKRSIASTGGKISGRLAGQQNKTIYTNGSCTPKTQVIIRRTAGKARGNIRVWEKRGSSWAALSQHNKTLEKNDSQKVFTVNSNKKLKIELRNVSVGNTLSYTMNALAKN